MSEELEYKEAQDYSKSELVVTLAKYRQLERGIATLTAERDALKAEQESTLKILKDGTAVHINMLRGTIATPTKEQLLHVIGDQRLCTAQSELSTSQQEVARLREELTKIREHGKGNSVWAASKESKMADAAISSAPAPVRTDAERLDYALEHSKWLSETFFMSTWPFGETKTRLRTAIDAEIERTKGAK